LSRPIAYALLVFSLVLNLTGLASLTDGLVNWGGIFRRLLDLYELMRELARHLIGFSDETKYKWLFNALVIWSSFFVAFRMHDSFEPREGRIPGSSQWFERLCHFLFGPFFVPSLIFLRWQLRKRNDDTYYDFLAGLYLGMSGRELSRKFLEYLYDLKKEEVINNFVADMVREHGEHSRAFVRKEAERLWAQDRQAAITPERILAERASFVNKLDARQAKMVLRLALYDLVIVFCFAVMVVANRYTV
jgi:hypothetical protein